MGAAISLRAAYRMIRAEAGGCPTSWIPDELADQLLERGAIWMGDGVYFASAEVG